MNETNYPNETIEVPGETEIRDPEILDLQKEIEEIRNPKKSIMNNLITLGISVILFFSMGLFSSSISDILILIGVIFIHELGHLAGMKLFKYKNVSMMFIPFLGAAVSGYETNPSGTKKALVSLMGPFPGILIGIAVMVFNRDVQNQHLALFANISLLINAFNLLPFYPLDGGRFFDDILFSRNPFLEIPFKVLAIAVLAFIAFDSKSWALGIFIFFMLVTLSQTVLAAKITAKEKREIPPGSMTFSEKVPYEFVRKINLHISEHLAKKKKSMERKIKANIIVSVWNKLLSPLPSIKTSLALVLIYVIFFLGSIFFYAFSDPMHTMAAPVGNFQWEEFSPDDGKFTISLPGYPRINSQVVPLGKESIHMNFYSIDYKDASFVVYATDIPEEKKDALKAEAKKEKASGAPRGLKSKVLSTRKVLLGKVSGEETEELGVSGFRSITRSWRVGSTVYSLAVRMRDNIFSRKDALFFLNSFKLEELKKKTGNYL